MSSGIPAVEGGLQIRRAGQEWVVKAAPIAGRGALFDRHGAPVMDLARGRLLWQRLETIGTAATWVAWRQRNRVCLECGQRACHSGGNGGRCTAPANADRFRGGHIPAGLRRWVA